MRTYLINHETAIIFALMNAVKYDYNDPNWDYRRLVGKIGLATPEEGDEMERLKALCE